MPVPRLGKALFQPSRLDLVTRMSHPPGDRGHPRNGGRVLSAMMQVPNRVLIAADLESSGIWSIGPKGNSAVKPSELLDSSLISDLKVWNDSADALFGGRAIDDEEARAAFWVTAHQLAIRVQEQLGDDWEVLLSVAEPDWCFRWVRPPAVWRSR